MPTVLEHMSRTPSKAEANARALLLTCLQSSSLKQNVAGAVADMEDEGWHRFEALAAQQRVRPMVRDALTRHGDIGVPTAVSRALDQQCREIATRILFRHAELACLLREFAAADIPVIVLKGACLANLVYRDIALREMTDVDLLVAREHLQAAVDVMVARGYEPLRRFSVAADVNVTHHVAPLKKGPVTVEVHWNVTLPGQPYSIDPGELWACAVPQRISGVPVLRLCLEDLLLHLCEHTSYHHQFEFGLRPSCDIAAVIARYHDRLDWDAVCERSARWRWSKGVYVALALARQLVGAAVPPEVLSRLRGTDSVDAVRLADRLLWTTPEAFGAFASKVAALGPHSAWSYRIRTGVARLFPPPSELAWIYALQPEAWWLPVYYVRRAWDLIWRHGPSAMRLVAGSDPDVLALAERRDRMRQWLGDSRGS